MKVEYVINSIFNSRTYIIYFEKRECCWLVDCGDIDKVITRFPKGCQIKGVLLTHIHFDHIYGLTRLLELFPEVQIITNEFGLLALGDAKLNMSKYHEQPVEISSECVTVIDDGKSFGLCDGIEAIGYFTPGHNPSCITYVADKYIFTGDSYIPGVKVVTNVLYAEKDKVEDSLAKIMKLSEGKIICPGHEVV